MLFATVNRKPFFLSFDEIESLNIHLHRTRSEMERKDNHTFGNENSLNPIVHQNDYAHKFSSQRHVQK